MNELKVTARDLERAEIDWAQICQREEAEYEVLKLKHEPPAPFSLFRRFLKWILP